MNIASERLILKELTWDDLAKIHQLHACPEVEEFNTIGIPKDINATREIIRYAIEDQTSAIRKYYAWTILIKDTYEFIGQAGINVSADHFKIGEIYYSLLPRYWKKGYATEAVKSIITFGFNELKLHRIQAGVATENVKSIHVLEKVGMVREGLRRKILPIRGEWKDNFHYAMLEDDPRDY